jgi:hypothetical protein
LGIEVDMKFSKAKENVLIIIDYKWYFSLQDEIDNWCFSMFKYYPREGMVLSFYNEVDLVTFLLRWS